MPVKVSRWTVVAPTPVGAGVGCFDVKDAVKGSAMRPRCVTSTSQIDPAGLSGLSTCQSVLTLAEIPLVSAHQAVQPTLYS